ncbi:exodeoxyribonuclease VII large subunit [Nocardioides alcanivorans]|uniref:exodeoxyribonuclease VII large subunit n=1 Tax=Nocardioides alcanivorans TaxID=2897352 RepID=UPI00289C8C42|nr:exodeoxyribonuclease VII large subunit [Nocardioides alcanivorans]
MPSLRDATADAPAPVRAVAQAVAGYIDKLGTVWVEGQIAQVSRRPTTRTVFITLRDTVADLSVSVTCARHVFDSLNPPLVEGASVVVHAKPTFYAGRGTFSLQAREIRLVGLGELLARLERRRQLLAAEGLFAAELKRGLPSSPDHRSGHCAGLRRRARRPGKREAPLAGGQIPRRGRSHAGHIRRS